MTNNHKSKLVSSKQIEQCAPERACTPEEQRKACLNCGNMGDFIKGLQGEIKRLQVSIFITTNNILGPNQ